MTPEEYLDSTSNRRPDEKDATIFSLLHQGLNYNKIGIAMGMTAASVEKRVCRLQAKRWATSGGRLLTPSERNEMIAWERTRFPSPKGKERHG